VLADPVVITAWPIPDGRPVFLAVLAVHVAAGVVCVVAGARRIGAQATGLPPACGRSTMGWSARRRLVTLSVLRAHDPTCYRRLHRDDRGNVRCGGASARLAAVCTAPAWPCPTSPADRLLRDNGPNLPLWDLLPHITYWLLPAAIGGRLLLRSLRRNATAHPREHRALVTIPFIVYRRWTMKWGGDGSTDSSQRPTRGLVPRPADATRCRS